MNANNEDLTNFNDNLNDSESLDLYISQPLSQTPPETKSEHPTVIKSVIPKSEGSETSETIQDIDDCEVELEILSVSPTQYHLPAGWKILSRARKDGKTYHVFESPTGKKYRSYKAVSQELSRMRLQREIMDCEDVEIKQEADAIVKSKYFEENSDEEDMQLIKNYETSKKRQKKSFSSQEKPRKAVKVEQIPSPQVSYREFVEIIDDTPAISEYTQPPPQKKNTPLVQKRSKVPNTAEDVASTPTPTPESKPKRKTPKPDKVKKEKPTPRSKFVLPQGWREEVVIRKAGATQGRSDYYWYNEEGKKFRSLKEIERYFQSLGLPFPSKQDTNEQQQDVVVAAGVVENTRDELTATLDNITNNNNNNYGELDTTEQKSQDLDFLDDETAAQLYRQVMENPQNITNEVLDDIGTFIGGEFEARDIPAQENDEFVVVMHNQESAADSSEGASNSDVHGVQSEDNRSSDSHPQFLASGEDE